MTIHIPHAADTGSVYCSPIWAKGSGPEWFWGLATHWCDLHSELQPSALRDTRHHPTPVGKSRGLDGAQGAPAMLQPRQNTKKPTMKDVFQENGWLCGCLGGTVVSKLTSYQECLSSSPRFWPSVQACMSLCGFPPTVLKTCTLGDSLLGGNVCPATNWTTFIGTSQYI